MRRLPYMSREWKDDAGRGVCLSATVNDRRFSVRSYATAREEVEAIGSDFWATKKGIALVCLTQAVSIDLGENVELYAG